MGILRENPSSSYLLNIGDGVIANQRGRILQLAQCLPVGKEVTLRDTDNCYADLPIYFRGEPMFRDPISYVIKSDSATMDCTYEFSYHLVNDFYISQQPDFKFEDQTTITKLEPKNYKGFIFEKNFVTVGTLYGENLNKIVPGILMSVTRRTMTQNWAGGLAGNAHNSILSSSLNLSAGTTLTQIWSFVESIPDILIRYWNQVLFYAAIIFASIITVLWISGWIKAGLLYGWRSNFTQTIILQPMWIFWDCLKFFLVRFGLVNNQENEDDAAGQPFQRMNLQQIIFQIRNPATN